MAPYLSFVFIYLFVHLMLVFWVLGSRCHFAVGIILSVGENKANKEPLWRHETLGCNVFSFPKVTQVANTPFPCRTCFFSRMGVRGGFYPRLEQHQVHRYCHVPLNVGLLYKFNAYLYK